MKYSIIKTGTDNIPWWEYKECCDICKNVIFDTIKTSEEPDKNEYDMCVNCVQKLIKNKIKYDDMKNTIEVSLSKDSNIKYVIFTNLNYKYAKNGQYIIYKDIDNKYKIIKKEMFNRFNNKDELKSFIIYKMKKV